MWLVVSEIFFLAATQLCNADIPSAVLRLVSARTRFSTLITVFPRTFNPADYAEPAQTEENYGGGSTWNNTGNMELEEGARKLICYERFSSNLRP